MELGRHSLEIGDAAGNVKSVYFECHLSGAPIFDQQKCFRHITLSDNNHMITHIRDDGKRASVAACHGYTTDHHTCGMLNSTMLNSTMLRPMTIATFVDVRT